MSEIQGEHPNITGTHPLQPKCLGQIGLPFGESRLMGMVSGAHRDRDIAQSPNSFAFTAIKLWNSLPIRNKEIESIVVFKKKLKEFVFYLRMIDSVNGLIFFTLTDLLLVFTVFYLNFLYICCLMTYDIFTCYCKDPVGNKL